VAAERRLFFTGTVLSSAVCYRKRGDVCGVSGSSLESRLTS
jgi:hypothetical protein